MCVVWNCKREQWILHRAISICILVQDAFEILSLTCLGSSNAAADRSILRAFHSLRDLCRSAWRIVAPSRKQRCSWTTPSADSQKATAGA